MKMLKLQAFTRGYDGAYGARQNTFNFYFLSPCLAVNKSTFFIRVLLRYLQGGTSVVVPYCSCCLCLYFGSSIMLVTYFVNFRLLNDHLFGKELFILFAASAFRKLSSVYVFSYFPFGFEGRIWDLIVSVPDHCLSFYFAVITGNHCRYKVENSKLCHYQC